MRYSRAADEEHHEPYQANHGCCTEIRLNNNQSHHHSYDTNGQGETIIEILDLIPVMIHVCGQKNDHC